MRKFKFEQVNSTPYKGLDGSVIFHDGTDPTHHILIEAVNGLGIPQSIVQTQQAPFQVGASPIRVTYGPRTISLECAIIIDCKTAAGKAAMEAVKRDLGNKLSPVGMGYVPQTSLTGSAYSTITGKLSYASDGTTYDRFIDCVPISCEFPNRSYSDGFQRFRLALFCPDPTWYGVENSATCSALSKIQSRNWTGSCHSGYYATNYAVAFNSTGNNFGSSSDGINWTYQTLTAKNLQSIAVSSSGIIVAVGVSNLIATSSNGGSTWTYTTPPENNYWTSIVWSGFLGLFVAVSYTGTNRVMTSPDGLAWTIRTGAPASAWYSIESSDECKLLVSVAGSGTNRVMTSPDGIVWTARSASIARTWNCVTYSNTLGLWCASNIEVSGDGLMTSPDGQTWTTVSTPSKAISVVKWIPSFQKFVSYINYSSSYKKTFYSSDGTTWIESPQIIPVLSLDLVSTILYDEINGSAFGFCSFGVDSNQLLVTYDGIYIFSIDNSYYSGIVENGGDMPAEFTVDIPVVGNETSKTITISDNFIWDGGGAPPSDHNLVFGTDGLKKGIVTVSTNFNDKDIRQFGMSKFNLYQQGTFFSLYISGATTNNIYVRNTGTNAGAPTIRWKNRYLGV